MSDVSDSLTRFFEYFWGSHEGYVYLPTKAENGEWKKVMFQWPLHKAQVVKHVVAANAAEKDVYFSPAIFKEPKPQKEHVLGTQFLWVDFDGSAPSEWAPSSSDAATEQHSTAEHPLPSLRIRSSDESHQHVYWKMDSLVSDVNFIEEKNRALAYTLGADTSGWDINQVLRPPHTTNYGRKAAKQNPAAPVVVEEESDNVYKQERFSYLKAARQLVNESINIDSTVPVEDILAKYSWDTDTYDLFRKKEADLGMDRSSALMRLGYYGAEQGMADEEIFAILLDADDRWGKFKKRDDRKKRLIEIINRARQKHPHPLTDLTFAGLLGTSDDKVEKNTKYAYGWLDLIQADFKVEWLFDGLLPKGGCMLISARGGVGKTQVSIQLAASLALMRNFIGYSPTGRGKSLMFGLEMSGAPTKLFVESMNKGFSEEEQQLLQRHFTFIPIGEPIPLEKPEGKKFFESNIEEYKPDLVIIDSFGKVAKKLQDDEYVRNLFAYLARVRNRYGCAFLLIHHNRKGNGDNKKPREQEDVYGSQYITSEPDTVITLWQDAEGANGSIEVREVKNRLHIGRVPFTITRTEHLGFAFGGDIDTEINIIEPSRTKGQTLEDADRAEFDL